MGSPACGVKLPAGAACTRQRGTHADRPGRRACCSSAPRTVQARHDRADRAAERVGGLAVAQVVDRDRPQHRAELGRQRTTAALQLVAQARRAARSARRSCAAASRRLRLRSSCDQHSRSRRSLAVAVDERVEQDAVQPRAQVAAGLVVRPEAPRAQRGLLHADHRRRAGCASAAAPRAQAPAKRPHAALEAARSLHPQSFALGPAIASATMQRR